MSEKLFEKASRIKLRFETAKGLLGAEDLWELPLQHPRNLNLDDLAQRLYRELKVQLEVVSFVKPAETKDNLPQLRFDIVKYIIDVKVAERDAAQALEDKRVKKQKLLAMLERKQDEALESKSEEEIRAMISEVL